MGSELLNCEAKKTWESKNISKIALVVFEFEESCKFSNCGAILVHRTRQMLPYFVGMWMMLGSWYGIMLVANTKFLTPTRN
jgi:hypothetical protein